jgi:hypothetical protein
MSNNELAVLSESDQQLLAAMTAGTTTGQETSNTGSIFPQLKMIQQPGAETPEGVEIPLGSFYIRETELFGQEILFRPLVILNKLMKFEQDENNSFKLLGESIYFQWGDEILDSLGGLAFGKVFGKARTNLSPEEAAINDKKAKLYMSLFGLVSFDGGDTQHLVVLNVAGTKYGRVMEYILDKKACGNIQSNQLNFKMQLYLPTKDPYLTPAEKKTARNIGYNLWIKPLVDDKLDLRPVLEDTKLVMEYINTHNNNVTEQHMLASTDGSSHDDGYLDAEYEEVDAVMSELEG